MLYYSEVLYKDFKIAFDFFLGHSVHIVYVLGIFVKLSFEY